MQDTLKTGIHQVPLPATGASISEFLEFWLSSSVLGPAEQQALRGYYHSYTRHFGTYLKHWYARQTQELVSLIKQLGRPTVLEIGCGCGTESLWAALHGAQVKGIDLLPELLNVARRRQSWLEGQMEQTLACTFECESVLTQDDSELFTIVFLEQAFHHLEPRAEIVGKLARLVAPRGYLILSEANGWNPLLQGSLFKRRGTRTITYNAGHPWGDERITVPMALLKQFKCYGLEHESLTYYRVFPNFPIADRLRFFEKWVPSWVKPAFTHFNLVLRKRA